MSKDEPKLNPKSPAKAAGITQDAELGDEQLNEVSGGFLGFFVGQGTQTPKTTGTTGGHHGVVRKAGKGQLE